MIYSFVESFHLSNLSKDKKDILISDTHACERLRKHPREEMDKEVIELKSRDQLVRVASELKSLSKDDLSIDIDLLA